MSGQPFCKTRHIARALGSRIKTSLKAGELGVLCFVFGAMVTLSGIYVLHEYILIHILSEGLEQAIRTVERCVAASVIVGLLLFILIMSIHEAIQGFRSLHREATEECDRS